MWMGICRALVTAAWIAMAIAGTAAGQGAPGPSTSAADLRARGLRLAYSLDYDEARTVLRQAIAADPGDPASYRQLAAVNWLQLLFRNGDVLVDDYLGEAKPNVRRAPPPADLAAPFHEAIAQALALAEQRLRERPQDPDAHFQVGATLGYVASYTATVDGRVLGGFRAARRAYEAHERVLELDPRRKDAGLIVGLYRYAVSTLPLHWRLLAHLAGFGGGRDRGLQMVEAAAAYPADARTDARFALIVMYSREARYDAALAIVEQLQREYPRNRLLWLEAGTTALRAGQNLAARHQLEEGLSKLSRDSRQRAFGEEARWHVSYAAAFAGLHETDRAQRELRAALTMPARDWVHGRAHKELGKLAALTGDRVEAASEYQIAIRLCRADDAPCADEAEQLLADSQRSGASRALRP
jgi:tetratricopeptide (TPR) repeat protein